MWLEFEARQGLMDLEVSVVAGWCEEDPEGDLVERLRRRDGMDGTRSLEFRVRGYI